MSDGAYSHHKETVPSRKMEIACLAVDVFGLSAISIMTVILVMNTLGRSFF